MRSLSPIARYFARAASPSLSAGGKVYTPLGQAALSLGLAFKDAEAELAALDQLRTSRNQCRRITTYPLRRFRKFGRNMEVPQAIKIRSPNAPS